MVSTFNKTNVSAWFQGAASFAAAGTHGVEDGQLGDASRAYPSVVSSSALSPSKAIVPEPRSLARFVSFSRPTTNAGGGDMMGDADCSFLSLVQLREIFLLQKIVGSTFCPPVSGAHATR